MSKIFNSVAGNHPNLNRFDLSYTNTLSCQIGLLYPVQVDEVYPGDVFKMSAFCHAEVMPMVAPLMSDLNIYAHTFFVPYRLIYGVDVEDGKPVWEKFITGGKDGDYDTPLPKWFPNFTVVGFSSKTIWDSIGFPMKYVKATQTWSPIVPYGLDVSCAPKLAYNFIYNNYYRDENLVDEVELDQEYLLKCAFKKDYFTSALEQQQRGVSPALDITGTIPVVMNIPALEIGLSNESAGYNNGDLNAVQQNDKASNGYVYGHFDGALGDDGLWQLSDGTVYEDSNVDALGKFKTIGTTVSGIGSSATLTSVNINNLRLMFAQQRLLELNERAGYRYTEFLSAHYGVSPNDSRLDRPEYIGGCIIPVNISVNIQSSASTEDSVQGNKVATANAHAIQKLGNYRVLEHGLIMTIISIRPKPIYQQGINRQWLRQSRFDYYTPEFAYLSENGIYFAELYADGVNHGSIASNDNDIFGYQACWNEMRCKNNVVGGAVREQLDYYVLSRKFGSRPHLNQDFIEIRDEEFNRVFAVQNEDEFVISWSNIIDAYRPIPAFGIPGKVDHVYGGN